MKSIRRIKRSRNVGRTASAVVGVCVLVGAAMLFTSTGSALSVMIDLGSLGAGGAYAYDVNDLGQVVATARTIVAGEPPRYAENLAVWSEGSGLTSVAVLDRHCVLVREAEINNRGQIAGTLWETGMEYILGFYYDSSVGIVYMMDMLGGGGPGQGPYVNDINEMGDVVVYHYPDSYIYRSGYDMPVILPPYPSGIPTPVTIASAVNDFVVVTGSWQKSTGALGAYIWNENEVPAFRDMGSIDGHENADYRPMGINNAGQVFGVWGPRMSGFFWDVEIGMTDLGDVHPMAMNDNGQIVGWRSVYDPFLWDRSTKAFIDLPMLSSIPRGEAWDINNAGQIAGESRAADYCDHACLWELSGDAYRIVDLGTMGYEESNARSINQVCQVVVNCITIGEGGRGFFWKTLTPQEASGELVGDIEELVGDENFAKSMIVKVAAAQNQMGKDNDKAAVAVLDALIKQIEALVRADKISEEVGAHLITQTQAIIDELTAPA